MPISRSLLSIALVASLTAVAGCDDGENPDELDGEVGGKEDSPSVSTLPVAEFDTAAWKVLNQWEETDTPAARKAGLAWGADSGLNWDEKYALWVESLQKIDHIDGFSQTFELTTPWDKTLPAPLLDCADVTLLLRSSFAAWHNLPFAVMGSDGGQTVFMGHFGIRTASGIFKNMPKFTQFADHSGMSPAEFKAKWPRDEGLRTQSVQEGDGQPFLGAGAVTGTYLDEIHLNKRAARFIRLLLTLTGSMHMADSRNTYNLMPDALRAGDTNLWRWQKQGVGHTMVTMRVDRSIPGIMQANSVFGNLPPNQPVWNDEIATRFDFTDQRGGGQDEEEDYAPLGGGIKRWRVAKPIDGVWKNTTMTADAGKRINDTDLAKIRERPNIFAMLLGQASPEERRDALLRVIEQKRMHLRMLPASCSAREARENAFEQLYEVMGVEFGVSKLDVDRMFRSVEDYVFGELVYKQSRTCCWNSTTPAMFDTIVDLDAKTRAASSTCVAPLVFKARDRDYDLYRNHNPVGWEDFSEDEDCPQADTAVDDVEAESIASPFCQVFGN